MQDLPRYERKPRQRQQDVSSLCNRTNPTDRPVTSTKRKVLDTGLRSDNVFYDGGIAALSTRNVTALGHPPNESRP